MKRSIRQVNKWRKKQGYSNFSTFVNAFHLIRLSLIMNVHDYAKRHSLRAKHTRP